MNPLVAFGQIFAGFIVGEDGFQLAGNAASVPAAAVRGLLRRHGAAHLRQIKREKIKRGELAVKALVEATPISGPAWV